jgi:hypothetical protein
MEVERRELEGGEREERIPWIYSMHLIQVNRVAICSL